MKFDATPPPQANNGDQLTASGCTKLLMIATFILILIYGMVAGCSDGLKEGDRVRVNKEMFALKKPSYSHELTEAAYHKDNIAVLQLMYDEKIRLAQLGTEGRVIMPAGGLVEVVFDDDPLYHWWIDSEYLTKIN